MSKKELLNPSSEHLTNESGLPKIDICALVCKVNNEHLQKLKRVRADMEFVTSGTSDTCVKYFWARVEFSRINAKN